MGVRLPTFFKDAKFLVKNFFLYQVLWTLFFSGGGGGVRLPTFFKDAKSEVKNFSQVGGGGPTSNFFPRIPNLKSKNFSFTKRSGLCFSQVAGGGGSDFQLFSRMPNFWSKIFSFTKRSGLCFSRLFFSRTNVGTSETNPLTLAVNVSLKLVELNDSIYNRLEFYVIILMCVNVYYIP